MTPILPPSAWFERFAHLIPLTPTGQTLDLACGSGRHTRALLARGLRVLALDRDASALAHLADSAAQMLQADIENAPWPLALRTFDGVVVTNYLWRSLLPPIVASVAPGGVLIYETFAVGNERHGKPTNPDFLLAPGELLRACRDLQVIAYEDVEINAAASGQKRACVQRIVATRLATALPSLDTG